jgi:DNA-binding MarR family transcriptional regulator
MSESNDDGRYAYDGLDRVLHEKARLGVLTALLSQRNGMSFTELARLCSLTDGNLSRHLDVLAEAGLVQITKGFEGRRPLTTCKLTKAGRQRFKEYLTALEQVIRDAAAAAKAASDPAASPRPIVAPA